jgi:hypothetical protein
MAMLWTWLRPETLTGKVESEPQQVAVSFINTAHVDHPRAARAVAPSSPTTSTGLDSTLAVVPLPSWPWELSPQHLTDPFANRTQEWLLPLTTSATAPNPGTVTGVDGKKLLDNKGSSVHTVPLPS